MVARLVVFLQVAALLLWFSPSWYWQNWYLPLDLKWKNNCDPFPHSNLIVWHSTWSMTCAIRFVKWIILFELHSFPSMCCEIKHTLSLRQLWRLVGKGDGLQFTSHFCKFNGVSGCANTEQWPFILYFMEVSFGDHLYIRVTLGIH